MKSSKICIFFVVLFVPALSSQTINDSTIYTAYPTPVIGWDSLKQLIQKPDLYPEHLRRAGVTATIELRINVDSTGNLLSITPYKVQGYDTLFIPPIERVIRSIEWKPGYFLGKYTNKSATLFFTFYLYYNSNPQYFLIGAPGPLIKKVH